MSFNWPRNANTGCDFPNCGCVGVCDGKSRTIVHSTATESANTEGTVDQFRSAFIAELKRENFALRDALNVLLVPYLEAKANGLPSGVYIQRFRFENAENILNS